MNRSGAGVKTAFPYVAGALSRCSLTPPPIGEIYAKLPSYCRLGFFRPQYEMCLDVIPVPLILSSSAADHEPIMYMSCGKKRLQALCDVPFPALSLPQLHAGSDDAVECLSQCSPL